jgi:hypothetical protein
MSDRGIKAAETMCWNPPGRNWREIRGALLGRRRGLSGCWLVLWDGAAEPETYNEVFLDGYQASRSVPLDQLECAQGASQ